MRLDGISLGILHSRMTSIVDEAAATLVRTAYSHIIRDAKDFAVGLLDPAGRVLSQSTQSIPVFLGTMSHTADRLMAACDPVGVGDVVLTNDPWIGSGHLPDVNLLMPVDDDRRRLGYVMVIAHMADIGGRILSTDGNEVYEEGLRIPPMWLYRAGLRDETLVGLLRANVRVPDEVEGDLEAMVAAGHVAARRVVDISRQEDIDDLGVVATELADRGEAAMRAAIRSLRGGVYRGEQHVEGIGETLTLKTCITIDTEAETITVDYAGTAPQVKTGHNATFGYTRAYTAYALKCLLAPRLPFSDGIFAPLDVRIPEGSVLNCRRPAAVGGRHLVGQSTTPLVIGALADVLPESTIAECGSPRPFITVAGRRADGATFSMPILTMGGFGARRLTDGPSAMPFPTNTEAVPVEVLEATSPLFVETKQLIRDSGGPGRTRGGLGQRMWVRCTVEELTVSSIATRTKFPAAGLFGGGPGAAARIAVEPADGGEPRALVASTRLQNGDRLLIDSPGGGGYGDPRERSRARLEADVADGYVSAQAAADLYGSESATG